MRVPPPQLLSNPNGAEAARQHTRGGDSFACPPMLSAPCSTTSGEEARHESVTPAAGRSTRGSSAPGKGGKAAPRRRDTLQPAGLAAGDAARGASSGLLLRHRSGQQPRREKSRRAAGGRPSLRQSPVR
eukprot:gene32807-21430_t